MPEPSDLARRAHRLAALNEAALAIAGDLDLDRGLQKILTTAARLVGARYGALGIPDRHGGFGRFLTVGISEQRAARIGALPRVHGVLGSLVTDGKPHKAGCVFRMNLDLSGAGILAHNFRNGYEVAVDSFGNMFMSDNDEDDGACQESSHGSRLIVGRGHPSSRSAAPQA